MAVPVGGWNSCMISRVSCPEGQQAWAMEPPRDLSLCVPLWLSSPLVVFLTVSVDPPPTPFFLNTLAKHLEESEKLASPQHRMLSDFQMWGVLPSR